MTSLDLAILVVYLGGITAWGAWLGKGARGGEEYFLGRRDLPWVVVLLSVVATETSTLTFLSIPGIAYGGSLAFVQIAAGYVLGRIAVASWLLPAYREGRLRTAYELLQARFGTETRRLTSGIFMITRLLADSVRLFATAIPLTLVTGWPLITSVLVIGAVTFIYTFIGGIRAVVWVDASQMALYLAGGLIALVVLGGAVPGGWPEILARAGDAGKLTVIDPALDFGRPYTLWAGLLGGAFLSMGSHGADQLIVQRLLACRDLAASRRALVGSGFAVLFQFTLFLFVGLGLWAWYDGAAFVRADEIFAGFIVEALPAGVRGLLIAGVFAAAMSTLSSSINALSSTAAYDFWAAARPEADERRVLRVGRIAAVLWTVLLVAAAIGFIPLSEESTAVEVSLGIASLVYGGLLGAFALARFSRRATSRSARLGIAVGIGSVTAIWIGARAAVAWPWFVLIGTAVTVAVGLLAGARRGSPASE
ncbi:MAG: sodium/solute symporter [Gemmatimonadales bacterium]|nr:sodium/solute symporter [Gemmatimonadales bacterium]MYG19016.1 sodium/solute symporter [Gemmatimonadales bacterium]